VPTDLPYTAGFVGRAADVEWLVDTIRTEHAVALLGRRAVGTSVCVVQAANAVRGRFPDGQLYLNLRKPDRRGSGRSLRPREVLDALCRKVGIDDTALAQARDLDAVAALLRSGLGDRQVLLVVDNVDAPDQVRPLLPPAARCRLLLAGGPALSNLDGVRIRHIAEPTTEEAEELFAAAAEDAGSMYPGLRSDVAEDRAMLAQIVELAGRQPHAVRVLGRWLANQSWTPAELLTAVHSGMASDRADATGSLLASRDRAYHALTGGTRHLVRLLALVRQPLSLDAVAALAGTNRARADRMLAEAADGAFVTVTADLRYALRPLLADYTRIHLQYDEPTRRRVAAQGRLVRYLAHRAERAAEAVLSGVESDDWFTRQQDLLRTVVREPWGSPGALPADPPRRIRHWWLRLAMAHCTWYASTGGLDDWAAICRAVLDAPMAVRTAAVAGWAHNELGAVLRWQGDPHDAALELTSAVALRHRRGAAQSRTNLGLALLDQGDFDGALDQLQRARRQRSPRDRAGQALTELGLGAAFLARAEPRVACHHLILAANRFEAIGDRRGYAAALTNLALAQWWLGERLDAAQAWSAALDCHPAVKDPHAHAAALLNAGAIVVAGAAESAGRGDRQRADKARELLLDSLRMRRENGGNLGRPLL